MIGLKVDIQPALAALQRLAQKVEHIGPALREIGEDLTEATKKRFESSKSPDGDTWAANKPSTLAHKPGTRPLVGETGGQAALSTSIDYQVNGDTLEVGSGLEYAAMQQFGGTKAQFPNLWGDIPARPYLGLSAEDAQAIGQTVADYLSS
ncbi:MAG: phage virion morphogenesis protein [Candidatus Methylumidiphilus sp.]